MKLLLVDDHRVIRNTLGDFLSVFLSAAVHQASSGPEALSLCERHHYDLIITDIHMPGMDGITFLQKIQKAKKEMKCIVLSMIDDLSSIKNALLAGVQGYVLKEGDTSALVEAISTVNNGKNYYSEPIRNTLMELTQVTNSVSPDNAKTGEAIKLLLDGCSMRAIAQQLHLSSQDLNQLIESAFLTSSTPK